MTPLLLAALIGCLPEPELTPPEPLSLLGVEARAVATGWDGGLVQVELRVDNPNGRAIGFRDTEGFRLEVGGAELVRSDSAQDWQWATPFGIAVGEGELAIDWADVDAVAMPELGQDFVTAEVVGQIELYDEAMPEWTHTLDWVTEVELPAPRPPTLEVQEVTVTWLDGNEARLDVTVAFDNALGSPLFVDSFDLEFVIDGELVAADTLAVGRIEPAGPSQRKLSLTADVGSLQGLSIYDDGHEIAVELTGTAMVNHPFAEPWPVLFAASTGVDLDCSKQRGVWYGDGDGDSFGDPNQLVTACAAPDGVAWDDSDCDDTDPTVHPAADEVCNNAVDDNCSGNQDEEGAVGGQTWYADRDGDSHGAAFDTVEACNQPPGFTVDATDCDDEDGNTFEGATEICDDVDNDCDDEVDEAAQPVDWFPDADGDGYGHAYLGATSSCEQPAGFVQDHSDCDDDDADANPAVAEVCDRRDTNCDGDIDEPGALGEVDWHADEDGDGFGAPDATVSACEQPDGFLDDSADCDDDDPDINPDMWDPCDGVDNDCDGDRDEDEYFVDQAFTTCAVGHWTHRTDAGNGYGAIVNAPGDPPMGPGAIMLTNLQVNPDQSGWGTDMYSGTPLSAFEFFEYSTYRSGNVHVGRVALKLRIDKDPSDGDPELRERLIFEPYNNGTVELDTWQTWNPHEGEWWTDTHKSGDCTPPPPWSACECSMNKPCPWEAILTMWPDAIVRPPEYEGEHTLGLDQGSWWVGHHGFVDALVVEVDGERIEHDFEVGPQAADPLYDDHNDALTSGAPVDGGSFFGNLDDFSDNADGTDCGLGALGGNDATVPVLVPNGAVVRGTSFFAGGPAALMLLDESRACLDAANGEAINHVLWRNETGADQTVVLQTDTTGAADHFTMDVEVLEPWRLHDAQDFFVTGVDPSARPFLERGTFLGNIEHFNFSISASVVCGFVVPTNGPDAVARVQIQPGQRFSARLVGGEADWVLYLATDATSPAATCIEADTGGGQQAISSSSPGTYHLIIDTGSPHAPGVGSFALEIDFR